MIFADTSRCGKYQQAYRRYAEFFCSEKDCIQARISSTRHAVTRGDNLTGAGKVPSLTFRHKVAGENGIRLGINWDWRIKPDCGSLSKSFCNCMNISLVSYNTKMSHYVLWITVGKYPYLILVGKVVIRNITIPIKNKRFIGYMISNLNAFKEVENSRFSCSKLFTTCCHSLSFGHTLTHF